MHTHVKHANHTRSGALPESLQPQADDCLCAYSLTKVCLSCRIWPDNYFINKVPGEEGIGKVPCTFHSLVAQTVKNCLQYRRCGFDS